KGHGMGPMVEPWDDRRNAQGSKDMGEGACLSPCTQQPPSAVPDMIRDLRSTIQEAPAQGRGGDRRGR
ncbi:MAG: hypothetical protein AAFN16_10930, partial [Pseudomonadota bacterium]